ncbi:MarR family winged helix-turn-helix transcriptional regulator [Pectobacterium wasabiae]|uniref:MarR family transcriptional regulator n=1 Tax=Pectobacterium wasabiae TaxID=55208 RepID=A0AAW3EMV5_9GAMM|nr:MarR family transcriptional regulator [Pectobacterium wasabiae]AOR65046.1 MarR family transcriptional regulator [Pectobacterium wasabiae CFBP 3304]EJS96473.1 Transcriptional repressor, MarR family [Pectobacterium wasabiae CFBP 3304]KFX09688.1 MarR family transcriptional regulator [Pectobacterium wasabiae]KGA29890.1 MarR family transcriptional regulator [Pectobacterium wasabiae]
MSEAIDTLETALSRLQCVLVARRAYYTPEKVSWGQYDILEVLRLNGPSTPSTLSDKLGITRTSMSKSLRVLKDLGFVTQDQDDIDRREQRTIISESGRDFLSRASTGHHDMAKLVTGVLTPGEQAIYTELCNKVSSVLDLSRT